MSYEKEVSNKTVYPNASFDAEAARAALKNGSSTVKGRVWFIYNDRRYWDSNIRVSIYPVTPHLEAWYKMMKNNPKRDIRMLPEAVKVRWDVRTDGDGEFAFTEMLPGRYFVQAEWYFAQAMVRNVYAGSGSNQYGTTDYYRPENYSQQ